MTKTPAGGKAGSSPAPSAAAIRPQSGWWPTTTTRSPTAGDRVEDILRRRARGQPVVGLDLDAGCARDLLRGLAGAEQRAREHGVRRLLLGEPAAEIPGGRAAGRGQAAKLVGVAGGGLRVADEIQAHPSRIGTRTVPRSGDAGRGADKRAAIDTLGLT